MKSGHAGRTKGRVYKLCKYHDMHKCILARCVCLWMILMQTAIYYQI
jgi:hypothetical protein